MQFQLRANFQPTGDQPKAIEKLTRSVSANEPHQVLLGVTGSGKTYTVANVIQNVQKPTLIIAHNKTLAAQLYQEFRDFFPNNAVSYFVSYYDYYQPEAYIPTTDTYIEKEATINDEIDKLRLASTTNLMTRRDVIIVASVSCIYNLGSPVEYGGAKLDLIERELISRETLLLQLANLQYERFDTELKRGGYRVRGDTIQLWPAYESQALKIETLENKIIRIDWIDPITGSLLSPDAKAPTLLPVAAVPQTTLAVGNRRYTIYPAKHYVVNRQTQDDSIAQIQADLRARLGELKAQNKIVEAYRLEQKVSYDLEMIREFGFVNGIENYSRYFDGRQPGDAPYSLLDHFQENARRFGTNGFLTIVDESHITIPQVRGMYNGDRSRKETLIDFGFRLPSALDNRPLQFHEFLERNNQFLYVSATPEKWEISQADPHIVEQLIRPTGLLDPEIELRPTEGQIEDLIVEVMKRKQKGQRVLVTTLTKKMAEALTEYLNSTEKIDSLIARFYEREQTSLTQIDPEKPIAAGGILPIDDMEIGPVPSIWHTRATLDVNTERDYIKPGALDYPKVAYLHSDIETLERSDILDDLRKGVYDVVVGINLLREGLDLPEVTLVAILDADKEGFLRSRTSLIQTIGRAARHSEGHAILYADKLTLSMKAAITETLRRRQTQIEYNRKHGITPTTIAKPIRERMLEKRVEDDTTIRGTKTKNDPSATKKPILVGLSKKETIDLANLDPAELTPFDKKQLAGKLRRRMKQAANDMDFELAALLRDTIQQLE